MKTQIEIDAEKISRDVMDWDKKDNRRRVEVVALTMLNNDISYSMTRTLIEEIVFAVKDEYGD